MLPLKAVIEPSILSADFSQLAKESDRVLKAGGDWLHVDIMDGHFVPNLTIGGPVVESLRRALPDAFLDCHLMVTRPLQWVEVFHQAGANAFCFHWEAMDTFDECREVCAEIREKGMLVGVALRPHTLHTQIHWLIDEKLVDFVLVMTVEPGFGGQKFMVDMLDKVKALRKAYPELPIQVDGGVSTENIESLAEAGATMIVAGTSIFKAEDPQSVISTMRKAVEKKLQGSSSS